MKKAIKFLKNNIFYFNYLLFIMLVIIISSTSARYISGDTNQNQASVGSFSVSASIEGVSGLSFTNTSFWSNSDVNSQIAMNALRSLHFKVNNYKEDQSGNKKISDVDLKYSLTFSCPKNFAIKLAMQVFDEETNPILPQIVISDLINSNNKYNTANSNDYKGEEINELEFNIEKQNNTIIAKNNNTIISIEEYEKEVSQDLLFRMWDTEDLTSEQNPTLDQEGGKVLSPLEVTFSQNVTFYKITIIMDEFTLKAGKEQTKNYTIKLAPTDIVDDIHLSGIIVDAIKDENGNIIESNKISEIYGASDKDWYIKSMKENIIDNYYDNSNFTGTNIKDQEEKETLVSGNVTIYKDGSTQEQTKIIDSKSITKEEIITTTKTSNDDIKWNDYEIITEEPNINTYTKNYVAKAININNNDILYYIHKLKVKRTGTQELTKETTKTTITPIDQVEKQTSIKETTNVKRIDGETETILLNITKTTITNYLGNLKEVKEITTTKYTRTYYEEGYIYRAYFKDNNNQLDYINDDSNPLLKIKMDNELDNLNENYTLTNNNYYLERIDVISQKYDEKELEKTTKTEINEKLSNTQCETTEYIKRKIIRTYEFSQIKIDEVKWKQEENNNKTFIYDEENKLNFYENNIQKLYLAQCYSKSYPFFIDVTFEQINPNK